MDATAVLPSCTASALELVPLPPDDACVVDAVDDIVGVRRGACRVNVRLRCWWINEWDEERWKMFERLKDVVDGAPSVHAS